MSKKMSRLDIMNTMGDAADKKAKKSAAEGSPMEEQKESMKEAKAEGDLPSMKSKKKAPKLPMKK